MKRLVEADPPEFPVLAAIQTLCTELDTAAISWCHWKSNEALHRSGTAENDLDLLFARTDAQRVTMLLAALGYREARPAASDEHTGIRDFFRWDAGADRFIHVHAHFRLVVGHDRTKNIQLPVERPFLASCT